MYAAFMVFPLMAGSAALRAAHDAPQSGALPAKILAPATEASRPLGETQPSPRSGGRAIARTVGHPAQIEMLQRPAGADPVADLGVARVESRARQVLQGVRILLAERADHLAVEFLVDREMAEAARRHDADAQVFGIVLDRFPDRLAEPVAAPRRGLVGRVVGVE